MIYNFSLPSLVLNAFNAGQAKYLTNWAKILSPPTDRCTYFNFLDTHDGIGILGAKGILTQAEIEQIFTKIEERGGKLSYRKLSDGKEVVYEINSTWWSALNQKEEPFELKLNKFITSRAISFALKGVPAVYYLSLFGLENDYDRYSKTKIKRDLNRTNLDLKETETNFNNKDNKEFKVFTAMTDLIKKRKQFTAFHPNSKQEVLDLDRRVFSLLRGEGEDRVLALHNLSNQEIKITFRDQFYILKPYDFSWTPTG